MLIAYGRFATNFKASQLEVSRVWFFRSYSAPVFQKLIPALSITLDYTKFIGSCSCLTSINTHVQCKTTLTSQKNTVIKNHFCWETCPIKNINSWSDFCCWKTL